jgi:Immunity protein 27
MSITTQQIDGEVLTLAQVDYLDLWVITRVLTATFGDDLPGDAPTVALEAVERLVLAGALQVGGLVYPGEFVASPEDPATAMAGIRQQFGDFAGPLDVGAVGWFALVESIELTGKAASEFAAAHLEEVDIDATAWTIDYRDRRDGSLWLMDYPQGELHGGGSPRLRRVPEGDT